MKNRLASAFSRVKSLSLEARFAILLIFAVVLIAVAGAIYPAATLMALQPLGILFAAGAAAASLLKSKGIEEIQIESPIIGREKKVLRRVSREARIGIGCLILGLLVSVFAKGIEHYLTSKRTLASQRATAEQLQRAEEQLNLMRKSLRAIERTATRFESLTCRITYEIRLTNQPLADLKAHLRRFAADFISTNSEPPNYTSQTADYGYVSVTEITGAKGSPLSVNVDLPFPGCTETNLEREVCAILPAIKELLEPIREMQVTFAISSKENKLDFEKPDLFVASPRVCGSWLKYEPLSSRLFFSWSLECSKTNWHQTHSLISVLDLIDATFITHLGSSTTNEIPISLASFGRPTEVVVQADKIRLEAREFANDAPGHRLGIVELMNPLPYRVTRFGGKDVPEQKLFSGTLHQIEAWP